MRDTLELVLQEFGDRELFRRCEEALARREMSYRDLMETEMRTIRTPVDDVARWLVERVDVRAGFRQLAEQYEPLVLSSGFEELIRPLLAREGVELEVVANRLDPQPDGWRVLWRDETACAECGDACKRGSLPEGKLVYAGDGYSDRCAALAADRVFARDQLAEYLDAQGVAYERFHDLTDIASALARRSSS